VRACSVNQLLKNLFQHSLSTGKYLVIPEPDYANAHFPQFFASTFILQSSIILIMLSTVELNSEESLVAVKIKDVATDWMLPAKFEA
jgi:hypothetical protein